MYHAIVIDCATRKYWLIDGIVVPSQGKIILSELGQSNATIIFVQADSNKFNFHRRMLELMGFELDQSNRTKFPFWPPQDSLN